MVPKDSEVKVYIPMKRGNFYCEGGKAFVGSVSGAKDPDSEISGYAQYFHSWSSNGLTVGMSGFYGLLGFSFSGRGDEVENDSFKL